MLKRSSLILFLAVILFSLGCSREDKSEKEDVNTCGKVTNVQFQTFPTSVVLNFVNGNNANSFRIEYGVTGFSQGSGKAITSSRTNVEITDLNPATTYDFFITGICSNTDSSAPYKLSSITTQQSECKGSTTAQFYQYDASQTMMQVAYSGGNFSYHEVEFGPAGFSQGSGNRIKGGSNENMLYFNNLQLNQTYDFYVRTYCAAGDANSFKKYTYTATPSCPKPFNLSSYVISGSCNVGLGATRGFSWNSYGSPQSYTIALIQGVTDPPGNQQFTTSNNSIAISHLYCNWKGFYVKSNCADGSSSEWAGPFIF